MDMIVNSPLIIELRKSKAWSQQHLADVSGLSLRTVQRIESSSSGAPDSIKAIAMAFSLVPADLLKSPQVEASEMVKPLKNRGQLPKLLPLTATFAAAVMLVLGIWLGSSSFTEVANAHDATPTNHSEVGTSNVDTVQQQAIMDAAFDWLSYVDSGDYQLSWQNSDVLVHSQVDAARWQTAVEPVRGALGKVLNRKLHSLQVSNSMPGLPDGEYVMLVLSTEFEHKAESFETVPMSKSSGAWKPMGYFIR